MYALPLEEITTDHIVARSIYKASGELLLGKGYKMTAEVIRILPATHLDVIWVQDENTPDFELELTINDVMNLQTKSTLLENESEFKKSFNTEKKDIDDIRQACKDTSRFQGIIASDTILSSATRLTSQVVNNPAVMVNLSTMRGKVGRLHQHAINTTVTALMLAKKFDFRPNEMTDLATGTLLMDCGYLAMPEELVNREGSINLDEYFLLREHPEIGYKILRENPGIPMISTHIAYQHHEHQDGSGYPRKLRGYHGKPWEKKLSNKGAIDRYAEIAAVADLYNRLLNMPHHLPSIPPTQIMAILIRMGHRAFNSHIIDALVTMIPIFPVGSQITITKCDRKKLLGCFGIVTQVDESNPEAPTITLYKDSKKNIIEKQVIDLREHKDITIQFINFF